MARFGLHVISAALCITASDYANGFAGPKISGAFSSKPLHMVSSSDVFIGSVRTGCSFTHSRFELYFYIWYTSIKIRIRAQLEEMAKSIMFRPSCLKFYLECHVLILEGVL